MRHWVTPTPRSSACRSRHTGERVHAAASRGMTLWCRLKLAGRASPVSLTVLHPAAACPWPTMPPASLPRADCSPECLTRAVPGSAATSTPRCSILLLPCSVIRPPGGCRRGSRPHGCLIRRIRASFPSNSSRPPTAISRSPAPRRSFSRRSSRQSGWRIWQRTPGLHRSLRGSSTGKRCSIAYAPRIRELPTEEWLSRLKGKVPCAPVRDLPSALHAEELEPRGMLASYDHPRLGEVRSVGLPLRVSGFTPTYRASPALGADAADLLTELGFDDAAVARLKEAGAFGL